MHSPREMGARRDSRARAFLRRFVAGGVPAVIGSNRTELEQ